MKSQLLPGFTSKDCWVLFILLSMIQLSACRFEQAPEDQPIHIEFKHDDTMVYRKKADTSGLNEVFQVVHFDKFMPRPILQKVWIDTSAFFPFSDTASQDRFWFIIVGDYEYNATCFFRILGNDNHFIYEDSFPMMTVLSRYFKGGGYYATKNQKIAAIHWYASELLQQSHLDDVLDDVLFPLPEDYKVSSNQQQLVTDGANHFFVYSKVENSKCFIGYDPILGKALKFYEY